MVRLFSIELSYNNRRFQESSPKKLIETSYWEACRLMNAQESVRTGSNWLDFITLASSFEARTIEMNFLSY